MLRKVLVAVLAAILFSACDMQSETSTWAIKKLPQITVDPEWETDELDTLFLSYVGFNTVPLNDGFFLMYDMKGYQNETLLQVGPGGELIRRVARRGAGPGELRAVSSLNPAADGGALVYDHTNAKAVHYNSELEVEREFVVQSYEGRRTEGLYPGPNDSTYLVEYHSGTMQDLLEDPYNDIEKYLVAYTPSINRYRLVARMHQATWVPRITNGRYGGSGVRLIYAPTQFLSYHPGSGTFFAHESGTGVIAEVDAMFDTLRTIPLNLPHEAFSEADMDSLKSNYGELDWDTLLEKLPERKHPVGGMEVSSTGEIWLQLNYRGDTQQWLVLDNGGTPKYVFHLPQEALMLHVGADHLVASTRGYTNLAYYNILGEYREQ